MDTFFKMIKEFAKKLWSLLPIGSVILSIYVIGMKVFKVAYPRIFSNSAFSVLVGINFFGLISFTLLSGFLIFFVIGSIYLLGAKLKLVKPTITPNKLMDAVVLSAFLLSSSLYLTENQFNLVVSSVSLIIVTLRFRPFEQTIFRERNNIQTTQGTEDQE